MRGRPDLEIGGSADPYMRRWYLIPHNRVLNIYLHQLVRDDDDRALHDHPWWNLSVVLRGGYVEVRFREPPIAGLALPATRFLWRRPGSIIVRRAGTAHRLMRPVALLGMKRPPRPTWSLFITGPRLRSWGFWCGSDGGGAARWVHWRRFTAGARNELVGAGCGEDAETSRRWSDAA